MTKIIDVSVSLQEGMVVWPGSKGFRLRQTMCLERGHAANVSQLDCDVHIGTHVDAPRHFLKDGATVEQLPMDILIGPAVVAYLPEVHTITVSVLNDLVLPAGTKRLLLRTSNSELWAAGVSEFREDFVALTAEAATWVVDRGIRLIGVDYLSVQRYEDNPGVHQILLGRGVIIIEGLNLSNVLPGSYELICLPLKLVGAEGAPARAVLRPLNKEAK